MIIHFVLKLVELFGIVTVNGLVKGVYLRGRETSLDYFKSDQNQHSQSPTYKDLL